MQFLVNQCKHLLHLIYLDYVSMIWASDSYVNYLIQTGVPNNKVVTFTLKPFFVLNDSDVLIFINLIIYFISKICKN